MERTRSPRYPSVALPEAIELARRIHSKDGMHKMPRDVAVIHMGYSSMNGASAKVLASVVQYGLLEGAGKNQVRLTNRALDVLHPQSDADRLMAIMAAASEPRVFAEITKNYPDRVPSEATLSAYLMRQQFTASAIPTVCSAYIKTRAYAEEAGESESHGEVEPDVPTSESGEPLRENDMQMAAREAAPTTPPPMPGAWRESVQLDSGEASITLPADLTLEAFEDFKEWMTFVQKRLERRIRRGEGQAVTADQQLREALD